MKASIPISDQPRMNFWELVLGRMTAAHIWIEPNCLTQLFTSSQSMNLALDGPN